MKSRSFALKRCKLKGPHTLKHYFNNFLLLFCKQIKYLTCLKPPTLAMKSFCLTGPFLLYKSRLTNSNKNEHTTIFNSVYSVTTKKKTLFKDEDNMLYIYNNLEEYLDILTYCTISLKFYKYNKKKIHIQI